MPLKMPLAARVAGSDSAALEEPRLIAGMRTDIESGPIEHRLNVRRLDRHIGCARRRIERKQAQADAGKYGSAAAGHVRQFQRAHSGSLFRYSCTLAGALRWTQFIPQPYCKSFAIGKKEHRQCS